MKKPEFPACESCSTRSHSIFCKLREEELTDLSSCKGCNQYSKGQLLFFQGSRPTGVFCINYGLVKIYRLTGAGKPQIIKLGGAGDMLGYEAILSNSHYNTFVEVIEKSMVCYIPKNHFLQMLRDNQELTSTLINQISVELINAEKRFTTLANKQVRERVAEALLLLNEFYGSKNKGEAHTVISLSREELASYAGTATESAVRILSDFKRDKLVVLGKRSIHITNHTGLQEIANRYEN